MKQIKTIVRFLFYIFVVSSLFISCKKQEEHDSDTAAALDCATAEELFLDASLVCDEAGYKNGAFNGILSAPCVTVTYDSLNTADEDTITIDFGTVNCISNDSIYRRGKMTIVYNGNYYDSAVTHTVTFNNFYQSDHQLNGSFTVLNNGQDSTSGHTKFHMSTNGNVILSTGGTISWNASRDRKSVV